MAYSSMTAIAAVIASNFDTLPSNLRPWFVVDIMLAQYIVAFKNILITQRLCRKQPYYK